MYLRIFIFFALIVSLFSNAFAISINTSDSSTLDGLDSTYFLNSSNQNSGTLPTARLTGGYLGITSLGRQTSLNVSGNVFVTGNVFFSKKSASANPFVTQDSTGTLWLGQNGTYNGTNVVAQATSSGSAMFFSSGGNISFYAGTLTAGNALNSYNPKFRIQGSNGYVGINTTSPQYQASIVGHLGVTGNIHESNSAYGGYFVSGNTTAVVISSTAALYDVTINAQTCTVIRNMTHSAGVITVTVAGTYEVEVLGNIDQKTANDDIHLWISKNNTNTPSWEFLSDTLDSAISSQPIACHGIFTLAANDTLRLKVQNLTGARNCRIENINFKVTRIAP